MVTKGYKVFRPDFKCMNFQFGIGTFEHDGPVKLCKSGFHFCLKASDCFTYYPFNENNIVCEVEAENVSEETKKDSKRVCSKLTVVKQLNWKEVLDLVNTGKYNTGLNNSGNYNTEHYNSGHYNSGSYSYGSYNSGYYNYGNRNSGEGNSGNYNSGNYNSGWHNSGLFNTNEPKLRLFNKESNVTMSELILQRRMPHVDLKFIVDGELVDYKQAWKHWWSIAKNVEKQKILDLPNFNAEIFEKITGIRV